ncbi:MAG: hypothetical protein E6R03_03355 [Hyphomicrobiaceae bacterium]|nr:MAG: hypothetical protein E6R03_03355 [Hyphomicrobiaceae bacterium]
MEIKATPVAAKFLADFLARQSRASSGKYGRSSISTYALTGAIRLMEKRANELRDIIERTTSIRDSALMAKSEARFIVDLVESGALSNEKATELLLAIRDETLSLSSKMDKILESLGEGDAILSAIKQMVGKIADYINKLDLDWRTLALARDRGEITPEELSEGMGIIAKSAGRCLFLLREAGSLLT